MSRKQIGGMVLAVLVAAAILLGAGLLVLRLPAAEKDPYTDLEETEIPYAVQQAVTFSVSTPPAVPENYPAIQMKIREEMCIRDRLQGFRRPGQCHPFSRRPLPRGQVQHLSLIHI